MTAIGTHFLGRVNCLPTCLRYAAHVIHFSFQKHLKPMSTLINKCYSHCHELNFIYLRIHVRSPMPNNPALVIAKDDFQNIMAKNNLGKKQFLLFRETRSHPGGKHSNKCQSWQQERKLNHNHEAERVDWKWYGSLNSQSPLLATYFLQQELTP